MRLLIQILRQAASLALTGLLAAVLTFASGAVPTASAATIEITNFARNFPSQPFFEPTCNMKLQGRIRPDDHLKIKKQLDDFRLSPSRKAEDRDYINSSEHSGYYALCLNSSGGEIREALKIGELFQGWMTVVQADEECISACAILFMMGERRDHLFVRVGPGPAPRLKAGRYLHYRAKLGFHAPRLIFPPDEPLTAARVEAEYDRAIKTIRALVFRGAAELAGDDDQNDNASSEFRDTDNLNAAQIARILENGDFIAAQSHQSQSFDQFIPNDLLLAILSVPSNEVFFVTTIGQAMRWGIEPYGFPSPPFISERMLMIGCANLVYARCLLGGPYKRCTTLGSGRSFFRSGTGNDEYFGNLRRFFRTAKKQLWPPSAVKSPFAVQGFTMIRTFESQDSYAVCDARVIYRDRKLFEIQLNTFNGQGEALRIDGSGFTVEDAKELAERIAQPSGMVGDNSHLRPWKMLPANRKLSELGNKPWADLEKGGPLFKP